MAVVLIEGFDHFDGSNMGEKGWIGSSFQSFVPGRGFVGGNCIMLIFANPVSKVLPSSYSHLIVGCAFRKHLYNGTFMTLKAGSSVVATLGTTSASRLVVTDQAANTAVGSTIIHDDVFNYVELEIVVSTSGSCELHLNGNPSAEIPSTVRNFGSTNIDTIQFECDSIGDARTWIDDLYIIDTTGSAPQND